jgi:protein-S-isoprenylcysteine O-methyltransferase Ste14
VAVTAALAIILLFFKARFEEKLLLAAYPDYSDYRRRTWGLFPGLHY